MRRVVGHLLDRLPYIARLRRQARAAGSYPVGHFYSPIPAHEDVVAHLDLGRGEEVELPDVRLNKDEQMELLKSFQAFYSDLSFPEKSSPEFRYHYDQTVFIYPDAIFLYSFLRYTNPKRIIEVGSGFSSAVILDTVERFFLRQPKITLIEPYPDPVKQLLKPGDVDRVTIIEKKVQEVPITTFTELEPGDLLFIDSSHVLKYGSDVQFLLFNVLPRLPVGIFVHFHDVFRDFEYPDHWLLGGCYWNEGYFLRAFLAYNNEWEVFFFSSYAGSVFKDYLAENMPLSIKDTGGSLYIRRTEKRVA